MSKMSDIAMQLDESAVELGFADHLEAMANGYDWAVNNDGTAYLFKLEDEQQKAHEAWEKERDYHIKSLELTADLLDTSDMPGSATTIRQAVEFFRGCHD